MARFFSKPHCENAEKRAKFQGIRGWGQFSAAAAMDLARFFPKPHCENAELRAKFQGIRGGDISPSLPWFWHALFQNCTVKTQNCVPNSRGSGGWEHFSATAAMDLARFSPKPRCENAELRAKFQGIRGEEIFPPQPWIWHAFLQNCTVKTQNCVPKPNMKKAHLIAIRP
ncbi:MAG: hypothetical protein IJK56_06370 [Firmicutes bacterium]|nr:hypothetical protein [Bacillota bacterium]